MDSTARLMGRVERWGPSAGDLGGLFFFAFWMAHARAFPLPGSVVALIDLGATVLVVLAMLSYQLAQGSASAAWVGWAAIASVMFGFAGQWALLCAGLMLFGISIIRCAVHPKLPGVMLLVAGTLLLVVQAYAPVFQRAFDNLGTGWRGVMGVSLVLVAAAFTDLDIRARDGHLGKPVRSAA